MSGKRPYIASRRAFARLTESIRAKEAEYGQVGEAIIALGARREELEARLVQLYEAKREAEGAMLRARAAYEASPAFAKNAINRRSYHRRKVAVVPILTLVPEPDPLAPVDPYTLYRREKERRKKREAA